MNRRIGIVTRIVLPGALLAWGCGGSSDAPPDAGQSPPDASDQVALEISTESLPTLHVFEGYEAEIEAVGGDEPFSFSASGLPAGLIIEPDTGTIKNDPDNPAITEGQEASVTITVTDDGGDTAEKSFDLGVAGVSALAAGGAHTCALDEEGAAWCWGSNAEGQLGTGSAGGESDVPASVDGDRTFSAIAAGGSHTCAVDESGAAWCWGEGSEGQLGAEGADGSDVPTPVDDDHEFVTIAAGGEHTCAIDDDGDAWCWGSHSAGQIGTGSPPEDEIGAADENGDYDVPAPVAEPGMERGPYTAIVAGAEHSCALDDQDGSFCWGSHSHGQLGTDHVREGNQVPSPTMVKQGHAFSVITAGALHTCGIDDEDQAWCWGSQGHGQLGTDEIPTDDNLRSPRHEVAGDHDMSAIAAGGTHTCGADRDGSLLCWGNNASGQLGDDGQEAESDVPTPGAGDHGFSDLTAGEAHACGLDDGVVWCWGENDAGQVGNADRDTDSTTPAPVHPSS